MGRTFCHIQAYQSDSTWVYVKMPSTSDKTATVVASIPISFPAARIAVASSIFSLVFFCVSFRAGRSSCFLVRLMQSKEGSKMLSLWRWQDWGARFLDWNPVVVQACFTSRVKRIKIQFVTLNIIVSASNDLLTIIIIIYISCKHFHRGTILCIIIMHK